MEGGPGETASTSSRRAAGGAMTPQALTAAEVVGLPRAVPPLPEAVAVAIAGLPGAADALQYRTNVLAQRGKLSARMLSLERQHAVGVFGATALAELWAWVAYLAIVCGYPENTTVAQYARSVGRLFAWAVETHADYTELPLTAFDAWQKWLFITHRNGTDWRTNQLAAVRQFYRWRFSRGMGPNCAEHTRIYRRGLRMAQKYTDDQLRAMLQNTATRPIPEMRLRDRAILLFLLATGARREELSRLSPLDLELSRTRGTVRFEGKGAKQREVSIEGPIVQVLQEWLGVRDALPFPIDQDALFVGLSGTRGRRMGLRTIESIIATHAKACGIRRYGVHRFRVNFATALYDAGAELEEIRVLLGHESIETTRRYIAVSERARKTRLSAAHQAKLLGQRNTGQPLWMQAALGGLRGE
jgi:site-specific recombinase XerD